MNLMRHHSKARGARRQTLRRIALLTLACMIAMAGSNFKFDGARTGAATKQQQQRTKLSAPTSKAPLTETEQTNKPVTGVKLQPVEPNVTSCANVKPTITPDGPTINGTLASGDCILPDDGSFYDEYIFQANAGQPVTITMSSSAFNPYLFVLKPNETFASQDFQGGATGSITLRLTLPTTGTYAILANSIASGSTGNYSLSLSFSGTTTCPPTNLTALVSGQPQNGTLAASDCQLPLDNSFYDAYSFSGTAGQQISIAMTATGFNAFVILIGPGGTIQNADTYLATNGAGGSNARLPADTGFVTLPVTGPYIVLANTRDPNETGSYTLTLTLSANRCPTSPISSGQSVSGSLASGDCLYPDSTFLDAYTFNSPTAGQQVAIAMTPATGSSINAFLFLLSPDGVTIARDGMDTNPHPAPPTSARIPATTGFFTLPAAGTYTIYANAVDSGQQGNYTLTLTSPSANCTYILAQASSNVVAAGGNFNVGVTTQAGCSLTTAQVTSNAPSWLTVNSATVDGAGAGTVSYSVAANTITAARTGTLTIAGQTFTVTQAAGAPACTYTLVPTSATVPAGGGSFNVTVNTQAGCGLTASQVTSNVSWLTVNSVTVNGGSGTVTYTAAANGTGVPRSGALNIAGQTFTVTQPELTPVATTLQFSAANYTVGEGDGQATITVTRANDISGGTATVEYRTADSDTFSVGCADTVNNQAAAFGRCDFATTVDTLTFAPGETSKTFVVPIINDAHVEANETFRVVLSNPTGAALGSQTTATVTITDNDVAGQANPIFQTPFFVRQQYLDFLAREPDAGGGSAWMGVLNRCADVNNIDPNNPSANCDRINVSGSFFGSPEFKDKGVSLIVFYRVAFNRLPTYAEFAVDLRSVTGTTPQETFAKRAAFAAAFAQRPEFTSAYGALSDTAYVAALLARYNNLAAITTIDPLNPDGTAKVTLTQTDLVNRLGSNALTRAQVLRAIVQSDQVSVNAEATNAFVASQYYGYLRRTPDPGGFNGWVNYLAAHPGDFRTMVNGFLNSVEYRLRFGPNTQ